MAFPGGVGRWEVRRSTFRQGGLPHHLLVLTDVSRPLRDEERQAWQRLMRVLGHEINNSLAPIKSIAGSLASLIRATRAPRDWRDDTAPRASTSIASRAEALTRFTAAYARLARLPQPRLAPVEIGPLVARVAGLETRLAVSVRPGPAVTVQGDGDQLEQLLINLVRNAVDAALETGGGVAAAGWAPVAGHVEIWVEDEGHGLAQTGEPVRPVLHDQARRIGHRPRAEPADRRSARRHAHAREPQGPRRLPGRLAPAPLDRPRRRQSGTRLSEVRPCPVL